MQVALRAASVQEGPYQQSTQNRAFVYFLWHFFLCLALIRNTSKLRWFIILTMTFSFPGRKQEGCIQPLLCFFNSSFIHVEFTATVWHPCLHAHYLAGCLGDARQDLYWCFGHLMKSAPYCCLWHAKKCMASRVGFFLFIIFANSAYDTTLWIPSPTVMLS